MNCSHPALAVLSSLLLSSCGGLPTVSYPIMPAALVPVDADHNRAKDFARIFCSTLPHLQDKDGRAWGACGTYLDLTDSPQPLQPIVTSQRWMLVPGFGGECLKDTRAFSTSIAHLKTDHQIDVEYFAVAPFGSGEENGKSIARQIDAGWNADRTRRYVLVGYDKGAVDILEALRVLDDAKQKVAAVVTIAGATGGSWVVDDFRLLMQPSQRWIASGCPGNLQDGVSSLLREVRQAFLRRNPSPVPAYSIVGATAIDETSSLLRPSWKRLSLYSKEQDGLIVAWEGVLPGAKYLGMARADHWAIALPFEESPQPPKAIDRNHFPRDALLEAIVRYVAGDLEKPAPSSGETPDRRSRERSHR